MERTASHPGSRQSADARHASTRVHSLPVLTLGLSLSLFFGFSFALCVLGYLLFPGLPVSHGALWIVLPEFTRLSWPSFLFGFAESLAFGWYIALIFGPLYNFFLGRTH